MESSNTKRALDLGVSMPTLSGMVLLMCLLKPDLYIPGKISDYLPIKPLKNREVILFVRNL